MEVWLPFKPNLDINEKDILSAQTYYINRVKVISVELLKKYSNRFEEKNRNFYLRMFKYYSEVKWYVCEDLYGLVSLSFGLSLEIKSLKNFVLCRSLIFLKLPPSI